MKHLHLTILLLTLTTLAHAQQRLKGTVRDLIVNEVMASNIDVVLDPSFNYGSWIELYNPTENDIDLGGYFISDDRTKLRKHRFPDDYGAVPAKGFKTIWFDHYGIWNKGELMQVPFKLDYDGGAIYIASKLGSLLITQEYPTAIPRTSYARTTDGGEAWSYTADVTPGKSNNLSAFASEQSKDPVIDKPGMIFNDYKDADFTISIPANATLAYTWDGSTPTLDNPEGYVLKDYGSGNIPVTFGDFSFGTFRCRVYEEGKLPSNVVTRTFIRNYNFTFPVISVIGDWEDIYGSHHGIMTRGDGWYYDEDYDEWYQTSSQNGRPGNGQQSNCNWNMDWDRPVNFEYFTKDGEYALNQEVDMSMCGGWSRAYTPHSFKIKAAKYYMGKNTLDHQFFERKPYNRHKTLQIRQGGNDNRSRFTDAAITQIVLRSGIRINAQEWQPAHIFINGSYHGTLNIREPNNKHYAYSNYGYDSDSIDQFEMTPDSGYVQKEGTKDAYMKWYDLSANAADADVYEQIKQMVDIDEFANYMAVQFYLGNRDWPQNNVKAFRSQADGKFHFVLFDLDLSFELSDASVFTTFAGKKNYKFNTLYGRDALGNNLWYKQITKEIELVTIFLNMLQNDEFRKQFIDSYCIVGGSVFEPNRVKDIVTEMRSELVKAHTALAHELRDYTDDDDYYYTPGASASTLTSKFTTERNNTMMTTLKSYAAFGLKSVTARSMRLSSNIDKEAKLYINGMEVPESYFNGKVFAPITFSTKVPSGYRFLGWTKELLNKDPYEYEYLTTELSYELPTSGNGIPSRLKAIFVPLTDEEMLATKTRPVMVNEISARNDIYANDYYKKSDWFELYNTTDSAINIAGLYITDNLSKPAKYQVPADDVRLNTVIPPHGHKVIWADKRENISSQIHADFKIDADSGVIAITADPTVADKSLFTPLFPGEWTDMLSYTQMSGSQTVGRYPDGAQDIYLMDVPSIGATNIISQYNQAIYLAPIETGIHNTPAGNAQDSGNINIAYVGDGIINVSSKTAIAGIRICNIAGQLLPATVSLRSSDSFATISLDDASHTVIIIHVITRDGKSQTFKVNI